MPSKPTHYRITVNRPLEVANARFRPGETLELRGVSHLKFRDDGKVFQHHDYFDMGEFIYERVHLLGGVIRMIKSRL